MSETIPESIGNFRITGKLGQGGMGAVFRAVHGTLERPVALKILPPEFASNPEYVARFLREARSVANLRNDNVVQVYDAGEISGKYYIAMELVDGCNLLKYAEDNKDMSEQAGLALLLQAAKGLAAAHTKGLVHRDIKPENILIGKDSVLRIVDFGLVMESTSTTQLTATGACLGTPMYMSPEQADGEQADARTDIYSLGVTFFRIFTGQPPFQSATVMNLLFKHKFEAPPDPKTIRPTLTQDTRNLLLHMMAKRREDRPQNAQALVEMLENLKAGKRIPDPPVYTPPAGSATSATMISPSQIQSSSGSAPKKPLVAAAILLVVLIGGGVLFAMFGRSSNDTESRNPPPANVEPPKTDYAAKGETALREARYSEAVDSFDAALRENPNDASLKDKLEKARRGVQFETRMQEAQALEAKGDLEAALARYRDAADLDSGTKAKDQVERLKTTIAQNKTLSSKEKNTERDAQKRLAEEDEKAGKFDSAAEHYSRAAALADQTLRVFFADKARECRGREYITRAMAAEEIKNFAEAENWYKKALELKPGDPLLVQQLEAVQKKARAADTATPDLAFDSAMREGQKAIDGGDLAKARAQFTAALALKPGNPSAGEKMREVEARELFVKGDALRAAGDTKGAETAYTDAIQKCPSLTSEATTRLKALVAGGPNASSVLTKVNSLVREQRDTDALSEVAAGLRANPGNRELKDAKGGLEAMQACSDLYAELQRILEAAKGRISDVRDIDDDENARDYRDTYEKMRTRFTDRTRALRPAFLDHKFADLLSALGTARTDASELGTELSGAAEMCERKADKAAEKGTGAKVLGVSIGVGGDKKKAQKYRDIAEGFRRLAEQAKAQSK